MARGSVGISTGTIIYTRGYRAKHKPRTPKHCDCRRCIHGIHKGVSVDCGITGDIAVHKSYCEFYKTQEQLDRQKKQAERSAKKKSKYKKYRNKLNK